jgi:hypothetical protein
MGDEISYYISELRHTIKVASWNYEIWWIYSYQESRNKYIKVLNNYTLFFQTSIHAHFVALVVALYRLFETRTDTVNFTQLMKIIKRKQLIEADGIEQIEKDIENLKPIWVKISIIRNEVFAHRNFDLTNQTFQKAGITPTDIKAFLELSKELCNKITRTLDNSTHAFNLSAVDDTESLLDDLKKLCIEK